MSRSLRICKKCYLVVRTFKKTYNYICSNCKKYSYYKKIDNKDRRMGCTEGIVYSKYTGTALDLDTEGYAPRKPKSKKQKESKRKKIDMTLHEWLEWQWARLNKRGKM